MAIKFSQGIRDYTQVTGAFIAGMNGGHVQVYSGTQPTSPNDAIPGGAVLLITIVSNAGDTFCDFGAAVSAAGQVSKDAGQVWSGNGLATNTATWFRHIANPADAGLSSTTEKRIQGNVGTSGADMNMSSVNVQTGAPQTVDTYKVNFPEG